MPCFELLDPDGVPVGEPPTVCATSIQIDKSLTKPGRYTILVTESGNDDTVNYDLSLTRIFPFQDSASSINYGQVPSDEVNPQADLDPFVFFGSIGDVIRVNATRTGGGYTSQVCIEVFQPDSTPLPLGQNQKLCGTAVQPTPDPTLTKDGSYMILVSENGNDDVVAYSLGLQCLAGPCPGPPIPPCSLKDTVTYDAASSILTMNFLVGNKSYPAAYWNGWLSYQKTVKSIFSTPQGITDGGGTPVPVVKTLSNVPKLGRVGVLSTLTTPKGGIVCSSWALVNTGTPGTAANEDTVTDDAASQIH